MIYEDDRGQLHSIDGFPFNPKQVLISKSKQGTLRGLHKSPYDKWIYCIEGNIIDFFINEEGIETVIELKQGNTIYIPANSMHGFYCKENSTIMYFLNGKFDSNTDKNVYWMSPEFNYYKQYQIKPIYISEKDNLAFYNTEYDILMLGASGYLGSYALKELEKNMKVLCVNTRLENINEISEHIRRSRCKYVVCAAGISGKPTIEWCENNISETWNTNYLSLLNLMKCCQEQNVHLTIFGSGLIYESNNVDILYTETDKPNYYSKVYSRFRIKLEESVSLFNNVLYLRILYPATLDGHQKCFVTKMLARNNSVHNMAVSMTIVPSLFPYIPSLLQKYITGTYNFVNKGLMHLPDIFKIYNISCNVVNKPSYLGLDCKKLESEMTVESVGECFLKYKQTQKK